MSHILFREGYRYGHCGENIDNMKILLQERNGRLVREYAEPFMGQVRSLKVRDGIVLVCDNGGKHNSVTLCLFLMWLAYRNGYIVDGPIHLAQHMGR